MLLDLVDDALERLVRKDMSEAATEALDDAVSRNGEAAEAIVTWEGGVSAGPGVMLRGSISRIGPAAMNTQPEEK